MIDRLFQFLGPRFLPAVILSTRWFAVFAGTFCVYYVNITLDLKESYRVAFTFSAFAFIAVAAVVTSAWAFYATRDLRRLLAAVDSKTAVAAEMQARAIRQAVLFPSEFVRFEVLVDPLVTIVPICLAIRIWVQAPLSLIVQVAVAGFLGLSCIILMSFLLTERCLQPVVAHLQEAGIEFHFDEFPAASLKRRLQIGFSVTILVTAVMIGGLAVQRVLVMADHPQNLGVEVMRLYYQLIIVTALAVSVGILFSQSVAASVTSRTDHLVAAMKRVQAGDLTLRMQPAGNDEIDTLARRFNAMIEELERKNRELQDLTANLEQQVETRTEQLIHSEKMTSLGQLVAGLAHEINNSINVVHNGVPSLVGQLDRIRRLIESDAETAPRDPKKLRTAFQRIDRLTKAIGEGAQRTTQIVRDLKQFSHPGTAVDVVVDINESLERCFNLLQVSKRTGVRIVRDFGDLPLIHGTLSQLDQVFMNVISNAMDAVEESGKVTVSTRLCGERIEVEIADDGPGMDDTTRKAIFDPFFTTKAPGKGTGLGMSISYGIVKRIGGEIRCTTSPGAGCQFLVLIPREPSTTKSEAPNGSGWGPPKFTAAGI